MIKNVLLMLSFVLVICAAGCAEKTTFSGSRASNDRQFLVDFDVLNTTVDGKMHLSEGEEVFKAEGSVCFGKS